MQRLQQLLDDLVASGVAGALLRYRGRDGQWHGSSGVAELGTDRPVDPDGWFRIGSVTKTFTAAVVLSMVHDGLVTLDDTCEQWLPGLIPGGDDITVRQLLNHTSGLHNYTEDLPDAKRIVQDRYEHWDPERAIEMARTHDPSFSPGTSWEYSNTNYVLLGLLIEAATGNRYATELEARVLRPLTLRRTLAPGDQVTMPDPHAHGYFPADGELVDMTDLNASQAWAAGALVATAADLDQFYAGLLSGALLGPAELEQMLTVATSSDYGLGIRRVELASGSVLWGHSGGIYGYRTASYHSADGSRQLTLSCTTAATEPDTDDILDRVFAEDDL